MRGPDLDRERSERKLTLAQFSSTYNEGLPEGFPKVSPALLRLFVKRYPHLFSQENTWSLDRHRKQVMDWLPMHLRSSQEVA